MRLNLGCGGAIAAGWVNVDRAFPGNEFVEKNACGQVLARFKEPDRIPDGGLVLDLAADLWPWEPESVDGIVLHHVLDLLEIPDATRVIRRCFRALRPDGMLRVSGADLGLGVAAALRGEWGWFPEPRMARDGSIDQGRTLEQFITQGGARKWWYPNGVKSALMATFGNASDRTIGETLGPSWITDLDSRPDESYFVEAMK